MSLPPHKLRVAFVTSRLDLGGTTTYLAGLTGALRAQGIVSRIFSLQANNPLAAIFTSQGVNVLTHDERRLIFEDRVLGTLDSLREFAPECVVAWDGPPAYECLRYLPAGVPRVAVLHGSHPQVYATAAPYGAIADGWVVVTSHIRDEFSARANLPPSHLRIIGAGVPVAATNVVRCPTVAAPLRLLYLGRLVQDSKRVRLLAAVYAELCHRQVPVVFTLAGDGPERPYLVERMQNTETGQHVRFLGEVTREALPALLLDTDVLLLVSDYEGLPVSLLEAMAQGVVPVASDLPGIRDAVGPDSGKLVHVQDTAGYALAIQWLHEHRGEMATMSHAGQDRVRAHFSEATLAEKWLTLLREAPREAITWPTRFQLRPRLVHCRRWDFYEPARSIRRWLKRWSGGAA